MAVSLREVLSSFDVGFNDSHCTILHVPLTLETIDFNQGIISSLIEIAYVDQVLLHVSKFLSKDGSEGLEIGSLVRSGSLVAFILGDSDINNIIWGQTTLGHCNSLVFSLGEVLKDPAVLKTFLGLKFLVKESNDKSIVDAPSLNFHHLSEPLTLCTITLHELLDDVVHFDVNGLSMLGNLAADL